MFPPLGAFYWYCGAPAFLPPFTRRTINNRIMQSRSAIVIGAGIVGLATARALAQQGFSVKVFERSDRAVGASIRNFGMIWPIGQPGGKMYDRAIRSREIWKDLSQKADFWAESAGSLHVAYHPDEW